jgi:hypothetical protein
MSDVGIPTGLFGLAVRRWYYRTNCTRTDVYVSSAANPSFIAFTRKVSRDISLVNINPFSFFTQGRRRRRSRSRILSIDCKGWESLLIVKRNFFYLFRKQQCFTLTMKSWMRWGSVSCNGQILVKIFVDIPRYDLTLWLCGRWCNRIWSYGRV